jgi:putative tricarboxylic transport membrane protein
MDYSTLLIYFYKLITPTNLLVCFLGALYGTLIGVLPGLTIGEGIAIISPFLISSCSIEQAAIIIAAVAYGSQYGSSTSAILLNIPGEPSSAITMIEGNKMTMAGKAKTALVVSAIASFAAGIISLLLIIPVSVYFSYITMKINTFHYIALLLLACMLTIISFNREDFKSSILSFLLGMALALVGCLMGIDRFTFGNRDIMDGISITAFALSLFGISIALANIINSDSEALIYNNKMSKVDTEDVRASITPILRGSLIGALGAIPGFTVALVTSISYNIEKMFKKSGVKFGDGAVEGVAGPEAANNSAAQFSLLPLILLGVPVGLIGSLLLGILLERGVIAGPQLLLTNPSLLYTLLGSMFIVNIFLLLLNWPLITVWIKVLKISPKIINYVVLIVGGVCLVASSTYTELGVAAILITIGVYLKTNNYNVFYVFLGFLLCRIMEENIIRGLTLYLR